MRLLLIEDNEDDMLLIREALAERNEATFELAWADRIETGLSRLANDKADAVLLDLSLPDSQGLTTLERVQTQVPDVPIIVLTGTDDDTMAAKAMGKGAQDYLVKHRLDGDSLVRTIRHAMERKRAERALRESEERLLQSQKLESVGQLAGGIAHDFNNLLTVINSYAEILLADARTDHPFLRNGLEQIYEAGHRAAGLTRQLLAFSRRQVLAPKVLDLNVVVSAMAKLLRRLIGEHIVLTLQPDPALKHVKADPGQVEQIIMNLVVNARDAMPAGGRVVIETKNVPADQVAAKRDLGVQKGYVMLAVSDTGCGMDAETQVHMFEPFFTTKGPGEGTGLGLATVHGIVKDSGGTISVTSEPGKGTTFKVHLPAVDDPSDSQAVPAAVPTGELQGSDVVLLAEDEEMVRDLTQAILERYGYTVLAAKNVNDAFRIAEEEAGPIHLLLTDAIMPGMNGAELAEHVRAIRPEIRVLYMSGYAEKGTHPDDVRLDGTAFIQKPFTPQSLAQKVRALLDEGRTSSDTA